MTVKALLITAAIILGVSILVLIATLFIKKHKKFKSILQGFFSLALVCGIVSTITIVIINDDAVQHGSYTMDIPFNTMIEYTKKSPLEDTLPENYNDLKGKIIIYYRFDCPDCHYTYKPLLQYLDKNKIDMNDVYFVSSRSEQGKKLMQTYPIEEVPSGVYIYKNQTGYTDYVKKVIYDDEDGTAKLDTDALNRLFELKYNESLL